MADFDYVSRADGLEPDKGPKPPADLSHHFSRVTARRVGSRMKEFYKYFQIPGIGNLAGGLPNAAFFPYDTLEAQIAQPERFKPTPNHPDDPSELLAKGLNLNKDKSHDVTAAAHMTIPHASATPNPLQKIDLTTALQYGTAQGYPPLYSFLRQFATQNLHPNIPYAGGADIILTNGNTDGLAKTIEALTNVWDEDRDWIREREGFLVEEFAYMNAVQAGRPRGLQVVPVKMDLDGMLADGPGGLEDVLENWDEKKGKRPHLLYTVTIGQNPTSGTLPVQRRQELYALCSKYDVIIIEDDPYWYLQFPSSVGKEAAARGTSRPSPLPHKLEKSTGYEFLDSLVPSYLNFDPDGRVVRLDTFSKTVAPGCRLGWITAQPAIIERILRITETSTQQPSGFVQSMIAELLIGPQPEAVVSAFNKKPKKEQLTFTGWHVDGWVRWLAGLRGAYEKRMNKMCSALEEGRFLLKQGTPIKASESDWAVISKTKMYSFDWPRGGMFIWMHVHYESHPLWGQIPGPKLSQALWIYLTQKPFLVLFSPGLIFSPTEQIAEEKGWQFFRLCFAAVSEDEVEKSSKRAVEGIKGFWLIKDKKELEDIEGSVNGLEMQEGLMDLGMNWAC